MTVESADTQKSGDMEQSVAEVQGLINSIKTNNNRLNELLASLHSIKINLKTDDAFDPETDFAYRALLALHTKKITKPADTGDDKMTGILRKLSAVRVELEKTS